LVYALRCDGCKSFLSLFDGDSWHVLEATTTGSLAWIFSEPKQSDGTCLYTTADDDVLPFEPLLPRSKGHITAVPSRHEDLVAPPLPTHAPPSGKDEGGGGAGKSKVSKHKTTSSTCSGSGKGKVYTEADFNYLKVLGRGSFGKVFLAQEKKTGAMSAVKALKKHAVIEGNDVHSAMTEKLVLALPPSPFLTGMKATFQTPTHLFFVMDLVTGGDLMFHLLKVRHPSALFPLVIFVCCLCLCLCLCLSLCRCRRMCRSLWVRACGTGSIYILHVKFHCFLHRLANIVIDRF
jgi:hypothetical protein